MDNKINLDEYLSDEIKLITFIKKNLTYHKKKVVTNTNGLFKDAAVLIPIFFKNKEPHLLFTKRTELVRHHKGQISFPGGMYDNSDKNLKETALRETQEEMGIDPADITILGKIDQYITSTNFLITPFVGYFPYPYKYKINSKEISQVIEVPLKKLLNRKHFETRTRETKGTHQVIHYYYYDNKIIWGVTGFLLSNFIEIIFDIK